MHGGVTKLDIITEKEVTPFMLEQGMKTEYLLQINVQFHTENANFSPEFIIFLDIIHLGLMVVFLFVSIYCLIVKKHWTTER